jgi:hypothetical protein
MSTVTESIRRLEAKYGHVPLLSAATDLKVRASSHKKLRNKLDRLDGMLEQSPLNSECASKFWKSLLALTSKVCCKCKWCSSVPPAGHVRLPVGMFDACLA